MYRRRRGTRQESHERTMPGSSPPEHAEREGREQRRIHEREDELEQVHDVVERARYVRCGNRQRDPAYGGHASHPQVVRVRCARPDVTLIDVVCPHGVERGRVACHPRHERRHQRRESQAEHSGRKQSHEHHWRGEIVVEHEVPRAVDQRRAARRAWPG